MAEQSKISWTDSTFNAWIGCTKVSDGCLNCYAERQDAFRHWTPMGWGAGQPRRRTSAKLWGEPVKWNAAPFRECSCGWRSDGKQSRAIHGAPTCPHCGTLFDLMQPARRRVFCSSLADVFDNEVDPQWRADLLALILATPNLDWMLLTKRIGNVTRMLEEIRHPADEDLPLLERLPDNVWLGASIVNQEEADRDIPKLLATPARVRFLSMEPLLGPVDLSQHLKPVCCGNPDVDYGGEYMGQREVVQSCCGNPDPCGIDWVIVGGESGPQARPMSPAWALQLRDQCEAAGIAFHFKQWGEWRADEARGQPPGRVHWFNDGPTHYSMVRVGVDRAGRELDGKVYAAFPGVA